MGPWFLGNVMYGSEVDGGSLPIDLGVGGWYKSNIGQFQERVGPVTPAVSDGDRIGTLMDQSGFGRHLVAETDNSRLTLINNVQNGLPGLLLDGVDDRLINTAIAALLSGNDVPNTIFYVSRSTTPAQTFQSETDLFYTTNSLPTQVIYNQATATGMEFSRRDDVGNQVIVPFSDDRSNFRILEHIFYGTTVTIRRNGVALVTNAAMNVGTSTFDRFSVGGGMPSGFFKGFILEVLIFLMALSDADCTLVRNYLTTRYGL